MSKKLRQKLNISLVISLVSPHIASGTSYLKLACMGQKKTQFSTELRIHLLTVVISLFNRFPIACNDEKRHLKNSKDNLNDSTKRPEKDQK